MVDLPFPEMDVDVVASIVKHSKYVAYHNESSGYEMEDFLDNLL